MKIIDPELTTDRTARWKPPDVQYDEFAVWPGGEFSVGRLPESGVSQLLTLVINRLRIHILNHEMRSAGAFGIVPIFVVSGKVVSRVGLHSDELIDSSFFNARPIKGNEEGALA